MSLTRILLPADVDPFAAVPMATLAAPWVRGQWRACWIHHPAQGPGVGGVALFRRRFSWSGGTMRLHLSADQRFRLSLDGVDLGGGPERGDEAHWRYHSWAGEVPAGEHILLARVWWLSDPPHAQCSVGPGFLCAGEGAAADLLDSGHAPWEVRLEDCWSFLDKTPCWGTGARTRLRLDAEYASPDGGERGWSAPAQRGPALHAGGGNCNRGGRLRLIPARLPAQREAVVQTGRVVLVTNAQGVTDEALGRLPLDPLTHLAAEAHTWQAVLDGTGFVVVPAGQRRRLLLDLGHYRCAYPEVTLVGHGCLRMSFAEACFTAAEGEAKGQRDAWAGLFFRGVADEFVANSSETRSASTLWWESGRFVEVVVEAGDAALEVHRIAWRETGYPLGEDGRFACSDAALQASFPVMVRTLARCAHETLMDCPYYEQLQYIGDTRLECQVIRALGSDHRLCLQALDTFANSLRNEGRLSSRWPTSEWQDIPTFSLMWIGMLHDALMWGGDGAAVRRHLGVLRAVLEHFRSHLRPDGLLGWVEGWNFIDWVPGWPGGEIPGEPGMGGAAANSWLLAYAARLGADIEEWAGDPILAARNRSLADGLAQACGRVLWDENAGCFADTTARQTWSEHAQLLALLAGVDHPREQRLLSALARSSGAATSGTGYDFSPAAITAITAIGADYATPTRLAQPTVYFSHYRFEAAARCRRPDLIFDRLGYWRGLSAQGFSTVPEMPEPSRSDCHAWGAHPRFHAAATILGIRPAAPLFAAVRIAPMLGPLEWAEGTWPHHLGDITVRLRRTDGVLHGEVELPPGLPGVLALEGVPEREIHDHVAW